MTRSDQHTAHFQIGVVPACVRTRLRHLRKQYTSLYRHYLLDQPQENEICVEVRPQSLSLSRRRYLVTVNGRTQADSACYDEVIPHIEWAFAWEVPEVMPEYLQLHSSAMEVDGMGAIFPGVSGSGKSTLTAALLTRGWRYLCDEFALIHTETLELHPYPRAICIKKPSYAVVESLGLKLHGKRNYIKVAKGPVGFINPVSVRPDVIGSVCPIRYVVFPRYTAGAQPTLIPISRAEAAFALHHVCYNPFKCRELPIDVLAGMIRGALCFRLISGEIKATCDLMENLVHGSAQRRAQSA